MMPKYAIAIKPQPGGDELARVEASGQLPCRGATGRSSAEIGNTPKPPADAL
jgi:hypothetical protein